MDFGAALVGNLGEILKEELAVAQAAIGDALREGGQGLRDELRAHTASHDLGKLGRAWAVKVYKGLRPLDGAALVYPKGRAAHEALWAFEQGAVIRPKSGRFLAIPTQFNRKGGRKGGKVLYRPDELTDGFVMRSKAGQLLLMARVSRAQVMGRAGVQDRAYVNTSLLGGGRKKRTQAILAQGAVPMFVLKPEVRIAKRLDVASIAEKWADRTARLVVARWGGE